MIFEDFSVLMERQLWPGVAQHVVFERYDPRYRVQTAAMQILEQARHIGNSNDLLRANFTSNWNCGPITDLSEIAFHIDHDRVDGRCGGKVQSGITHGRSSYAPERKVNSVRRKRRQLQFN